ncbi:MAG: hypothetical protein ACFFAN_06430 [Promethearchaeota archaeon]
MSGFFGNYLRYFGEIKFGEEKSMSIGDFERSFKKYFASGKKNPLLCNIFSKRNLKIDNFATKDFKKAIKEYFK